MMTQAQIRRLPAQTTGIKGLINAIFRMEAAWRQRQKLAQLDSAALEDMGLTRAQVAAEMRRGLWNAPQHWKR